jgi:hypothetical protein
VISIGSPNAVAVPWASMYEMVSGSFQQPKTACGKRGRTSKYQLTIEGSTE